jgi:hypothetical protein
MEMEGLMNHSWENDWNSTEVKNGLEFGVRGLELFFDYIKPKTCNIQLTQTPNSKPQTPNPKPQTTNRSSHAGRQNHPRRSFHIP